MDDSLRSRSTEELISLYDKLWGDPSEEVCEQFDGYTDFDEFEEVFDESDFFDSDFIDDMEDDSFEEGMGSDETESFNEQNRRRRNRQLRTELRELICEKYNQDIWESGVEGANEYKVVFSEADTIDQVRIIRDREKLTKNVQAYILNLAAPSDLFTLEEIAFVEDCQLDMESAIDCSGGSWTAPRWAKPGDIIFYMHGKSANAKIARTKSELKRDREHYTEEEYRVLSALIEKETRIHKQYGGKIFAVGQLIGAPEYIPSEELVEGLSFHSRVFAEIGSMYAFENPLNVEECNEYLHISLVSGITPVDGDIFDRLKGKLKEKKSIPTFLEEAKTTPLPLQRINDENWMTLSNDFRREFMFESQFRYYYVDRLLRNISGQKKIFRECRCKKDGISNSFIDNVIRFEGRYLPVEVKLSILVEKNIKKQVRKYCYDDFIVIDKESDRKITSEQTYCNRVLIVDTSMIFMFNYDEDSITEIEALDSLKDEKALSLLREKIKAFL